eukprot:g4560.t1
MDVFDRERRREEEERELLRRVRPEDRFTKLLKSSQSLVTHIEADSLIPTLHRGPEELKQASHRLSVAPQSEGGVLRQSEDPKVREANRIKAQRMLARSGYDPEKLQKDLVRINLQRSFEPYEPLGDTDVEGYLKHHHDIVILTAIEEAKKSTVLQSQENFDRVMDDDWQKAKATMIASFSQEWGKFAPASKAAGNLATPGMNGTMVNSNIRSSFALSPIAPGTPFGNDGPHGTNTSFPATPGLNTPFRSQNSRGTPGGSVLGKRTLSRMDGYGRNASEMSTRMLQYAKVVWKLNNCCTSDNKRKPFGIATMFRHAEENSAESSDVNILGRCWQLLAMMLSEKDRYIDRDTGTFIENTPEEEKLSSRQYIALLGAAPCGVGGFGTNAGSAGAAVEKARQIRRRMLWGARQFLEIQMRNKVQREMGNAGGRPALRDQVLGFLEKKLFRNRGASELDEGDFFWPALFYMLRCGCSQRDLREFMYDTKFRRFSSRVEMEIGRTDSNSDQGRGYDDIFCLVDLFVSRNADVKVVSSGSLELTSNQKAAIDSVRRLKRRWAENRTEDWTTPYMDATLNLICHFDSRAMLRIPGCSLEDAMWQKICFILAPVHVLQDQSAVPYSLHDLSAWVLGQDRKRFKPIVYFNALLLCLEFEQAIGYLASFGTSSNTPFKDVVHFAVALHHYGALRTPGPNSPHSGFGKGSNIQEMVSYCVEEKVARTMPGFPELQQQKRGTEKEGGKPLSMSVVCFERLLRDYTRTFEQTEPDKACEYMLLLRTGDGRNRVCDSALHFISEIVLASGCFDSLLGDEQGRAKGYLNKSEQPRLDEEQFRNVVDRAARRAKDKEGQYLQAVSLYLRTNEYRHVVAILNQQLSRVVVPNAIASEAGGGRALGQAKLRLSVRQCAEDFVMTHVQSNPRIQELIGWNGLEESHGREGWTLQALLYTLMPFFDLCLENKWRAALQVLEPLKMFPVSEDDLSRCAEKFEHADEAIRRNMHHLMLAKMEALYTLHLQCKRGSHTAGQPVSVDFGESSGVQLQRDVMHASMMQWRREARLLVVFANLLPSSNNYTLPDNVRAQLFRMQVDMET